jgi:N12 class adenine-specific DNA methylase
MELAIEGAPTRRLTARRAVDDNLEVLRALRDGTADQTLMGRWHGWGAAPQIFAHPDWAAERAELEELVGADGVASAERTTLNAHYTDPRIARAMWDAVPASHHGPTLEPGCGRGVFMALAPDDASVVGVELDPTTARVAQARFAGRREVIGGSFADTPIANGQAVAAIGNVPFGAYRLFDPTDNPARRLSIHDHFLAKSARSLAPGGIGIMLTSRYTMDAIDPAGREAIGAHADFVGAARLPSTAHVQEAGCEVVTDIVVLRGRAPGTPASHVSGFVDQAPADIDGVRMSQYFVDNPRQVLGEVTSRTGRYSSPEMHITGSLDDALTRLPGALNQATGHYFEADPGPVSPPASADAERAARTWDVPGSHRLNEAVPEVCEPGGWVPVTKQAPEVAALIRVRDALDATLAADQTGRDATTERASLQSAYDTYRAKYGPINRSKKSATGRVTRPSQGGFRNDPRWPAVSAIETVDHATGEITPARIIEAPVAVHATAPTSATSDADALNIALGHTQRVDVDFVGQLRNEPGQQVMERLEATGAVFCDPTTSEWITRSDFLSGPVRTRHAAIEALDESDPRRAPYLAEIEAVLPAPATADDLYDTFGGPWIPAEMVNEFVNTRIGGRPHSDSVRMCDITWDSRGGWNTIKKSGAVTARWETDRADAHSLAEAALNGTSVTIRDSDGDGNSWVNEAATAEASDMIAQIREEWDRWAFEDPERADRLCAEYTRRYRSHVPRDYTEAPIDPQGLRSDFRLRPHQEAAIARILQSGDSLLAHPVGAGKTAEMVVSGMELARTGQIALPCYAVPGHMLEQFSADITDLYPSARVLSLQPSDITAANRERLGAQLQTGQWDAVVVTHGTLRKWPLSPEAVEARLGDRLAEIDLAIDQAKQSAQGGDGPDDNRAATSSVKKLQRQRENAQEKAKSELAKLTEHHDQHPYYFDHTPIDWIAVDEAHLFKNLPITSKARIAGVATAESQRSVDLLDKITTLREQRPGSPVCVLATGTPVSNTAGELWVMARFVDPEGLKRLDIDTFDSWRSMFAKTTSELELGRDGALAPKERLAQYRGLRQMARWTSEWADIVQTEDLGLPLPDLTGGERRIHEIEPDPGLAEWITTEAVGRARALKSGGVDPTVDNHLKLDHDVTAASFDWHGYASQPEEPEHSLIWEAARGIANEWHAHSDDKFLTGTGAVHPTRGATHIAFCDVGTPKAGRTDTVYDRLRDHLVELGIPRNQIGFAHEHDKSDAAKEAFFDSIRNGKITVAVSSTEKMGMGTNVQTRLSSLHHLSCPHKPSDIEQREGRIVRQGNQNDNVSVHAYVVKRTGSIQQWQRVQRKAGFVGQVMRASLDGPNQTATDDPELIGYAAIKEAATGDEDFGKQAELEGEVRQLAQLETRHKRAADSAARSLPNLRDKLNEAKWEVRALSNIVDQVGNGPGSATWKIDGKEVPTAQVAQLLTKWTANRGQPHRCPETITLEFGHGAQTLHIDNRGHSFHLALPDNTYIGDPISASSHADVLNTELAKQRHAIQFAGQRIGPAQNRVEIFDAQVDQQTERTTEPFRHSTRLTAARTELADVSRRLLTRYADPGTVERLDAVLGARPPGTAQMDQAWQNMRTEAVANPDLLRRWEQLTDVVGRQVIGGQHQPITPVDPTLAGFDPLVQQLHRQANTGRRPVSAHTLAVESRHLVQNLGSAIDGR